jgi:hypothetical protein
MMAAVARDAVGGGLGTVVAQHDERVAQRNGGAGHQEPGYGVCWRGDQQGEGDQAGADITEVLALLGN